MSKFINPTPEQYEVMELARNAQIYRDMNSADRTKVVFLSKEAMSVFTKSSGNYMEVFGMRALLDPTLKGKSCYCRR